MFGQSSIHNTEYDNTQIIQWWKSTCTSGLSLERLKVKEAHMPSSRTRVLQQNCRENAREDLTSIPKVPNHNMLMGFTVTPLFAIRLKTFPKNVCVYIFIFRIPLRLSQLKYAAGLNDFLLK